TKGGYLFSASVNAATGEISQLEGKQHASQTTSTPVVYKGRVYYGATDGGFGSGKVVVADAVTLDKLFEVNLKGYPQCSLLLSTAYEETEGYLYLYSTYNYEPGGISLIKVKPDCNTAEDSQLIEIYGAEGFEQYCITSIICGPDGTLYYKNDSGNVLAVGVTDTESVENLINKIGTVTIDSESAIKAAREAYDSLSNKDDVSNYSVLEKAEKDFEVIAKKVDDVEALIAGIGKVSNDDATKAKVKAAREAYEKLSEAEKAKVENYHVLTAAEMKLDKLKGPGTVENTANKDNAYSGSLDNSREEIYNKLLTAEEKALVEQGTSVKVSLSVKDISSTVSASNKALIEKNLGKNKVGLYLDITLSKQIGDNAAVNVTETNGKVKVTISVPDSLKNSDASITRTYKIMRIHEGKVDILDATYDAKTGRLVFETDAFSTYALVYSDAPVQTTAPKTGDANNMVSWLVIMTVAMAGVITLRRRQSQH
ncbi:MAG: LPXTG cell wall anchor domain-containing protein, partial [Firmicutes bacterium]|nr:LPXTG cell wall anchor domain-containing protein [Bacillota bacterium]